MRVIADTRDITSYLRAFAITAVVANHYVNAYLSTEYKLYANGIIAIFFVLSGYGIFYSLSAKYASRKNKLDLLRFYYSRAVRILPLYWLSLLVDSYIRGEWHSLSTWLANPVQAAPSLYWFITFLIQCYLIAPLLYILFTKLGLKKYLALITVMFLLLHVQYYLAPLPGEWRFSIYRFFPFGHIFLFSLGFALSHIISGYRQWFTNRLIAVTSFVAFLLTVYSTRDIFYDLGRLTAPLFILSTFSFCLYMISINPKLPLGKILMPLGKYSYSVYLFHVPFLILLSETGVIVYGNFKGVVYTVLLFPIFFLACAIVEKYTSKFSLRLLKVGQRIDTRGSSRS